MDRQRLWELISLPFRASGEKPRFVKISRAHVSGASYLNIGEAGVRLLRDMADSGMRVKVRTTLNPGFAELSEAGEGSCAPGIMTKQKEIADSFLRMGVLPTFSCTPYLEANVPRRGEHLAWAESSAVLYSNTIMGAWTNKESGIGALAAAIIGVTSRTGVHTPSGRLPKLRIEYKGEVSDEATAGALGYVVGGLSGEKIPAIRSEGLLDQVRTTEYLAALGTSGSAPMAVIEGVSPRISRRRIEKLPSVKVSEADVRHVLDVFKSDQSPEAILIGCPHAVRLSARAVVSLSKAKLGLPVFVFTSRRAKNRLGRAGLLQKLHARGIDVVADACIMWCGLRSLGYRSVITNSVKGAYYLRNQMHIDVDLRPLSRIVG